MSSYFSCSKKWGGLFLLGLIFVFCVYFFAAHDFDVVTRTYSKFEDAPSDLRDVISTLGADANSAIKIEYKQNASVNLYYLSFNCPAKNIEHFLNANMHLIKTISCSSSSSDHVCKEFDTGSNIFFFQRPAAEGVISENWYLSSDLGKIIVKYGAWNEFPNYEFE